MFEGVPLLSLMTMNDLRKTLEWLPRCCVASFVYNTSLHDDQCTVLLIISATQSDDDE